MRIETTVPVPQWIEGMNRMDLNIVTSEFTKQGFDRSTVLNFKMKKLVRKVKLKMLNQWKYYLKELILMNILKPPIWMMTLQI